ncbi:MULTISPECIES: type I secretion system permease/ATPase [unclassified Thauera]|uniref:type I secretion system permease/ATPase n=1 Tax=unclassified Thauera TaxID=2609274 RepID=UPI0002CD9C45|nr:MULTISPECIES: type I secretion system permease/ATPase [unclassified Thauera]ENO91340.1 ABC transporter ATP-binding/permease protein [Thauera sp. 28]HNR61079.1 type I secretion system permease/ATPase [Thauera sp.]HNS92840.1 type I secretion system permease/ATPase [Thauera sp.]
MTFCVQQASITLAPGAEPASTPEPSPRGTDALLACLLVVAQAHGLSVTREAVLAGLPLEGGRLGPALFERAASRAGLSSRIVRQALEHVEPALLPAVLLLEDGQACVLMRVDAAAAVAEVVFPELGDSVVTMALAELRTRYVGVTLYARPRHRFDARTPEVRGTRAGHWFWSVMAENRALYRDVLLAALVINVFALALPLFSMNVYDRVVPNNAIETLWALAIGVMIVICGDFVLRMLRGYFVDLAGSRADVKLSAVIMEKVLGLRMEARPDSAGSFASNLRAFESVRDFISSATVTAFIDLPFALLFVIVIGWIGWPMVIPFVVGITLLLLYSLTVQRRMHALAETTYRASAQRNATLVEGLVGMETVKAMGAEAVIQGKWEKSAALVASVGARLRLLAATSSNGALWVQQMVSLSTVIIGVYLISEGELTMGGLIACYLLSSRAMAPIGQVAGLLVQYHSAATAFESLEELMQRPVERPQDKRFLSRPLLRGDIEFRNVSFAYGEGEMPALREVSFTIRTGERVGILGRVGSGKTTLEKLILGLYQPTGGAVLVDGIDLRQLDPAELRRNIGYVPQDVTLFYGSLRDNIVIGMPEAGDDKVLRAARIAGIADFVDAHPHGYGMLVGERGESLSGGQRQGVAIARALVADPPILLLDEPSASMDHASEEALKQQLRAHGAGKTLIVITHRTSLLDLVDRIIVIDAGRIVADGPKAQVVDALRQGRIGRAG